MENAAKDIQVESIQPPESLNTTKPSIPDESPAKKTSVFCFKKRKKSCEKVTEDGESDSLLQKPKKQMPIPEPREAEGSDPSWSSRGAWLAFKRLVTLRRRKNKSSWKRQAQSGSQVQLESNGEDPGVSQFAKERGSSSLKMPCLRFSRSKKASCSEVLAEELECDEKANNENNCEPESVALEGLVGPEHSPNKTSEEQTNESRLENTKDVDVSGREDMFAVEMKPDPDQYMDPAVQSEIVHSETVLETEQEKQIFQLHHGSLYGNPTEAGNERFDFQVEIGPLIPLDLPERQLEGSETEEAEKTQAQDNELEQGGRRNENVDMGSSGTEEANTVKVMLHCSQSSSVPSDAEEEAKPEENKPAMPGAGIVIMITEAEDYHDEEVEPDHPCETFSFSQANKQKGKKRSNKGTDSGAGILGYTREGKTHSKGPTPIGPSNQEHRTSEQYERLLIETAASLVKAAIQSSIEQLLNEMALELNKQNSFL